VYVGILQNKILSFMAQKFVLVKGEEKECANKTGTQWSHMELISLPPRVKEDSKQGYCYKENESAGPNFSSLGPGENYIDPGICHFSFRRSVLTNFSST
jgi:hypothetical protein